MGAERKARQQRAKERREAQTPQTQPLQDAPEDRTVYGQGNGADRSKNRFGYQAWTTDAEHVSIENQSVADRLRGQFANTDQGEPQAQSEHPTDALQQLLQRRTDNSPPRSPMQPHPLYGEDDL